MANAYASFRVCQNCERKADGCHIGCKARKLELELRRVKNQKAKEERIRQIEETEFFLAVKRNRRKRK